MNKVNKNFSIFTTTIISFFCSSISVNSLVIQTNTQEAFIFGKNNRVNQVSYQTLINSLFLEIDLEEKLDTSLGDELNASINNFFNDELNYLINSLLASSQIKTSSDIFYTNSNSQLSINVPEPTFTFSLLVLGVLGIKSALLRKKE